MPPEKRPVRIVGTAPHLLELLNASGLELTSGTAQLLRDGRWEVMGYASDDATASLRNVEVHDIRPDEPQPFERAASRNVIARTFVRIEGTRGALRELPDLPGLTLDDHGARALQGDRGAIYADATDPAISALRALGFEVNVVTPPDRPPAVKRKAG